jgi:hypothetical protein
MPVLNPFQSIPDRRHAPDAGKIIRMSDDHKIVVHQGNSFRTETVGNKFLLQRFCMGHHQINLAFRRDFQCGTGSRADVTDANARFYFKLILQRSNDSRIDRTDRAGQENKLVSVCGHGQRRPQQQKQHHAFTNNSSHLNTPFLIFDFHE